MDLHFGGLTWDPPTESKTNHVSAAKRWYGLRHLPSSVKCSYPKDWVQCLETQLIFKGLAYCFDWCPIITFSWLGVLRFLPFLSRFLARREDDINYFEDKQDIPNRRLNKDLVKADDLRRLAEEETNVYDSSGIGTLVNFVLSAGANLSPFRIQRSQILPRRKVCRLFKSGDLISLIW